MARYIRWPQLMNESNNLVEAIEVLQQLGLKEYEARCFVGLSQLSSGTAKQLSELTQVPRTRVYDAVRVLEEQGLVEIQHSSPQQFRAVSLDEAVDLLQDRYEEQVDRLRDALEPVEIIDPDDDDPIQEIWSMAGDAGIEMRTNGLIEDATEEVVLVIGDQQLLTSDLVSALNNVEDDVDLLIGSITQAGQQRVQDAVPGATTFVSGLEWLSADITDEDAVKIGRLLLVDRGIILVSSIDPDDGEEHAIFGEGFKNGLVVIARRLMAQGLIAGRDTH